MNKLKTYNIEGKIGIGITYPSSKLFIFPRINTRRITTITKIFDI
jgi:hypothetical protein